MWFMINLFLLPRGIFNPLSHLVSLRKSLFSLSNYRSYSFVWFALHHISSWSNTLYPRDLYSSIFIKYLCRWGTTSNEKVFKNGPRKVCGRQPLKNLKGSRPYPSIFFKGCLPQNFTWPILEYDVLNDATKLETFYCTAFK